MLNEVGLVMPVPPGPDQAYVVAPPPAVPVSVRFWPEQTGFGLAVAVTPVTGACTTTDDEVTVTEQIPFTAVRVYTPEFASATPVTPVVNEVGLVIAVPPGRTQLYVEAPVAAPVNVRLSPTHKGLGEAVAETLVGEVTTVTVPVLTVKVGHPATLAVSE